MADTWGTLVPTACTRAVTSHPLSAAVYNAWQQGDRAGILGMVRENVRRAWSPWLLPLANPLAFMNAMSPGAAVRDTLEASGNLSRSVMRGDPWGALGAAGMGMLAMASVVPWLAPAKVATKAPAPIATTTARTAMPDLMTSVPPPAGVQNSSRSARMNNPMTLPQRAFSEDYPQGARHDAAGRLTHDVEGRELGDGRVPGRRMVGAGDVALPQTELIVGRYREWLDPVTGHRQRGIALSKALSAADTPRVLGHEIGHAIAEGVGPIPTDNILKQLRRVYNDLNGDRWRIEQSARTGTSVPERYWTRPEDKEYRRVDVDAELWAEAIRAYMADPNYLKTVAPDVAARIRERVNSHPRLSPVVQFNSMLAPLVTGGFGIPLPGEGRLQ